MNPTRVSACFTVAGLTMLLLSGCMSASQHAADVQKAQQGDRLTVGSVQREIRVGMSGAEVAQALGSPNIVSTDEKRREVWIYDKIATDTIYSTSAGGFGGVPALIIGPFYSSSSGAVTTNQRTLTIIVKFDEEKLVRDFAYHASSF